MGVIKGLDERYYGSPENLLEKPVGSVSNGLGVVVEVGNDMLKSLLALRQLHLPALPRGRDKCRHITCKGENNGETYHAGSGN